MRRTFFVSLSLAAAVALMGCSSRPPVLGPKWHSRAAFEADVLNYDCPGLNDHQQDQVQKLKIELILQTRSGKPARDGLAASGPISGYYINQASALLGGNLAEGLLLRYESVWEDPALKRRYSLRERARIVIGRFLDDLVPAHLEGDNRERLETEKANRGQFEWDPPRGALGAEDPLREIARAASLAVNTGTVRIQDRQSSLE